jgi:hypothetical protein
MNGREIREQLIVARDEYINLIKAELLGPGSEFTVPDVEHELISSSPMSRYSVGILYPQKNHLNQDNDEIESKSDEDENPSEDEVIDEKLNSEEVITERKNNRNYESDETADENLDEEVELSTQYMPSSMGITFIVKGSTDVVHGKVSFATYRKATIPDCIVPYIPTSETSEYVVPSEFSHIISYDKENRAFRLLRSVQKKEIRDILERDTLTITDHNTIKQPAYRLAEQCKSAYVREPHDNFNFDIDFSDGDYIDNNKEIDGTKAKITALRTRISENIWSITIMLVNESTEVPAKAHHCIYQPVLTVLSSDNSFIFTESNVVTDINNMDDEERSLELLYRDKKIYGTGLGVSVDWCIDNSGKGNIWSDYFPVSEVPPMNFDLPINDKMTVEQLSMKYLSDLDNSDKSFKLGAMRNLVDLYKKWVDELEVIASKLDPHYKSAAAKNIADCKHAYDRMYSGISTLENDENTYSAFVLANRAMFMQRVHLRMQQQTSDIDRYPGDTEIEGRLQNIDYCQQDDKDCRWRPFQIAFLLMDINSVINDKSPERDIVDLIWFPTGGGKTEAYLGLTAFTIFYRRLTHLSESDGTAVIMRYTLRLLAAQQFTRAATLICACEYIRQDCVSKKHTYPVYTLGKDPITIGLWIGGSHIPNKNIGGDKISPSAKICLEELRKVTLGSIRYTKERFNKFQVLKCPWCGTKLVKDNKGNEIVGSWGYEMRDSKHFYMHCTHEACDFTAKLPIQIIDEELYENPPTLLFGTVDKFAMLPWDGRIGSFFAVGSKNRSPELIIQDELHLISGALGTIVGLYETAVDAICSQKDVSPKIIASTATIRRAKEQCSVLYNREVVQFPSPGLDSGDSFFAREAEITYENNVFGRKYIGIMPSGKTKAMMEIRTMAALLQRIYMMNLTDEVKDKLWTLTVYFNSLKDLGKASTLVEDDVKDFIIRTGNRLFAPRRLIVSADELTSRVTTTELNETLDKLEKLEYSRSNIDNKRYASNILLATNMISVGIDVARLNIMLLIGQPKLTSEYIQASSRVGRSYPGVAFVQYDATKSRDRSHYESFKAYHDSFYRFVEPTGATPFSKPARERALHAVITAMIRQRTGLVKDEDAVNFDNEYFADDIRETEQFILERIKKINARTDNGLEDDIAEIKSEIEEFIEEWNKHARMSDEENKSFYFGRRFMVQYPSSKERRLLKSYNSDGKDTARETLTSMRNVDVQVCGEILIWEEK